MNWTEIIDNDRRSPRRYPPRDDKPLTLPPGEREIWISRLAPFNRTAGPGTGDQTKGIATALYALAMTIGHAYLLLCRSASNTAAIWGLSSGTSRMAVSHTISKSTPK